MDRCWIIKYPLFGKRQKASHTSYQGGKPHLPQGVNVPTCKLCGSEQVFFFQVTFPDGHPWQGYTLSVFSCKVCFDEQSIIPERFCPSLKGVQVPSLFLKAYQTHFRVIVFPSNSGILVRTYIEKVRFVPWRLVRRTRRDVVSQSKVGGVPCWSYMDETPGPVDGVWPVVFILQLDNYYLFPVHASAPRQWGFGKRHGEYERMDGFSAYWLFAGGPLYMFGATAEEERVVICLTQR